MTTEDKVKKLIEEINKLVESDTTLSPAIKKGVEIRCKTILPLLHPDHIAKQADIMANREKIVAENKIKLDSKNLKNI